MEPVEQIAVIFGWAMVPFIFSVVYGCTSAGSRKIAPMQDVLAIIIGVGAYWGVSTLARGQFADWRQWGILLACGLGFLALHFAVLITYKVFYAGLPDADVH